MSNNRNSNNSRNSNSSRDNSNRSVRYYNVCYPREYTTSDGETRTDFVRIGRAFPLKDADGFRVELYASPPLPTHAQATSLVLLRHEPAGSNG